MIHFGIEQEHFIFKNKEVPSLQDMDIFFQTLLAAGLVVHSRAENGRVLSVSANVNSGSLIVKNDFCTHILEVAFPPFISAREFASAYRDVFPLIESALSQSGMQLKYGGVIEAVPETTILAPHNRESAQRARMHLDRKVPDRQSSHILYAAAICATQIHLDILEPSFYQLLPDLYSLEYLFPLLFSNSKNYQGYAAHCIRPFIIRDSYADEYKACAIPEIIPESEEEYLQMIQETEGFLRDYSFIAVSKLGTVEFRGGCSQNSLDEILEMLSLRLAIYSMVKEGGFASTRSAKDIFDCVCKSGHVPSEILSADLILLTNAVSLLTDEFQKIMSSVLYKIEVLLERINSQCCLEKVGAYNLS